MTLKSILLGTGLFVLLASFQQLLTNPFADVLTISITLLVPVLFGMLYGARVGFLVGILGPIVAIALPNLDLTFLYVIIPNAIAGALAGMLRKTPIAPVSLIVGHVLLFIVSLLSVEISLGILTDASFYLGLGFEIIMGIIGVTILALMYKELFVLMNNDTI